MTRLLLALVGRMTGGLLEIGPLTLVVHDGGAILAWHDVVRWRWRS